MIEEKIWRFWVLCFAALPWCCKRLILMRQSCNAAACHAQMYTMGTMLHLGSPEQKKAYLQTHGGFGFAEEYDVEQKFRETRLDRVAPISTNLIVCFLAEKVVGLPKSYGEK